jgi:dihydroorotate dehydrogenase
MPANFPADTVLYSFLRPLLFRFDPETAHHLTLDALRALRHAPGRRALTCHTPPSIPVEVMGLRFDNPVGLAAGLDKNGECADMLAEFGFGFVEVGTVTPRPQPGNPRPRVFRLPERHAIINRLGFNNHGVNALVENLKQYRPRCPVGINIGRNKDTPNERALDDYLAALRAVYLHADYVTVNISSPNTPGLRALQEGGALEALLRAIKAEQAALATAHSRRVPIALKIAPDLDDEQIAEIARLLLAHRFDAVIATNTTITRPGLDDEPLAREPGGLSGRPLRSLSTHVVRRLYATLRGQVPIIGVGGILNADDAWEKLLAGADLVQIYSALIYRGPGVVREIVAGLVHRVRESGATTLSQALARQRTTPST